MESVTFCSNRASEKQIAEHLSRCDESFVPPLSDRVDIADYAHKIAGMAMRFEAWDSALVGLLAVYCNDRERGVAYVTSVSVLQEWRGRGIAASLVERCIAHARAEGFRRVELEVDAENANAVRLYEHQGFSIDAVHGRAVIMRVDLGKGG
jgi:ribosomal protein S18 acetylase RimI-like enzyme